MHRQTVKVNIRDLFYKIFPPKTNDEKIGKIIQRSRFSYGKLDLIHINEPGVVTWKDKNTPPFYDKFYDSGKAAWKLTHQSSRYHLVIALLNIDELKEERLRNKKPEKKLIYTRQLLNKVREQRGIDGTHLVIFAWIPKLSTCSVTYHEVISCNFSVIEELSNNAAAKKITLKLIKYLVEHIWVPNNTRTWEETVKSINLRLLLNKLAKEEYNIDTLQPPRLLEDDTDRFLSTYSHY